MKSKITDIAIMITAISLVALVVLLSVDDFLSYKESKRTETVESTPIVIIKDLEKNDIKISDKDIQSYINENLFICPECGKPLCLFSSHGIGAASAQFRCYECSYQSAEVYKESYDPDQFLENECREECIRQFKNIYGSSFDTLMLQIANEKNEDGIKAEREDKK